MLVFLILVQSSPVTPHSQCPYRHSIGSSDPSVPVCDGWLSDSCTNKYCGRRHPGPNAPRKKTCVLCYSDGLFIFLVLTASGPVLPVYALSNLQIDDDGKKCEGI